MAAAIAAAGRVAWAAEATPATSRADTEASRVRGRDPAARDGPLGPLDRVEPAIEEVVQDHAAGVQAGGRRQQPRQGPAVPQPRDSIPREHVRHGRHHVRRAQQLQVSADQGPEILQ